MVTRNKTEESREGVLDPRGVVETEEWSLAERLDSLSGATVGLLNTRKTNADVFLEAVGESLRAEYGVGATVYRTKATAQRPPVTSSGSWLTAAMRSSTPTATVGRVHPGAFTTA
jgi:hypothetical protein